MHLMDPAREQACFVAFSPRARAAFGYVWRRADFPWLGIWKKTTAARRRRECSTLTRGMEFGVSPMPETRRQMVERGAMFGGRRSAGFRRNRADGGYCAALAPVAEPGIVGVGWPLRLRGSARGAPGGPGAGRRDSGPLAGRARWAPGNTWRTISAWRKGRRGGPFPGGAARATGKANPQPGGPRPISAGAGWRGGRCGPDGPARRRGISGGAGVQPGGARFR